jgi:hypothetical protein
MSDNQAASTEASKEAAPAPKDWWEEFRHAVEDPKVNTYEYLRDNLLKSLELDGAGGFSGILGRARRKALKELAGLTDPKELSQKLQSLEGKAFLFNDSARAGIKVFRVILDSYATADEASVRTPAAAEAEKRVAEGIENLSRTFEGKDEEQIRRTIKEAARQMQEESTLAKISADIVHFAHKYLKPDTLVTIMVAALPLITWQYYWALALGLGVFAARRAVRHGGQSLWSLARGRWAEARESGRRTFESLKEAGATILVIGVAPLVGWMPKAVAGFAGMAIEAAYKNLVKLCGDMLSQEKEKPGSTPLGRRLRTGVKGFFAEYQDALASNAVRFFKETSPNDAAAMADKASKAVKFSQVRKTVGEIGLLGVALARRFNLVAQEKHEPAPKLAEINQAAARVARDVNRLIKDFKAEEMKALPAPAQKSAPQKALPQP